MSEWKNIESAPKDGTKILVFKPSADLKRAVNIDYWSERLGGVWARSRPIEQPTHWMPLPEPPQ